MNLLALDTSTEQASVALCFKGEIRNTIQSGFRNHAQFILPMIEKLLAEAQCTLNQLDAIVYGRGPGSFTGLRISCSIAKGLAYSHNLPLIPVSTLSAIAHEAWIHEDKFEKTPQRSEQPEQSEQKKSQHLITNRPRSILAMLDARMNQVYWGVFRGNSQGLAIETQEFVTDPSEVHSETLYPNIEESFILAGVNFEPYLKELNPILQEQITQKHSIYPKASTMIQIASMKKIKPVSAAEASLVYIRNQITQRNPNGHKAT